MQSLNLHQLIILIELGFTTEQMYPIVIIISYCRLLGLTAGDVRRKSYKCPLIMRLMTKVMTSTHASQATSSTQARNNFHLTCISCHTYNIFLDMFETTMYPLISYYHLRLNLEHLNSLLLILLNFSSMYNCVL